MFYYESRKKEEKEKTIFLRQCVLHLTLANFLRSLLVIIVQSTFTYPYHITVFCHIISVPFATFRVGEHVWSSLLAYALLHKITITNLVVKNPPGSKILIYLAWILSLILAIIGSSDLYDNPLQQPGLCSFYLQSLFLLITFWLTCIINTGILCYIIYYMKKHNGMNNATSFKFYVLMFLAFEYLRLPYYAFTDAYTANPSLEKNDTLNIVFDVFLFIYLSTGAVTSLMFAYNLNYLDTAMQYCKNCLKKKEIEEEEP